MTRLYEHKFIETNGVRVHVMFAGDPGGCPVVLLHGFPEYWYGWRHQIPAFISAGYRLIIPDQRGYNLSDKPKGIMAYKADELVLDVIGLLDHLGIDKVDLAGHDWGGAVAWGIAINHPQRIRHLGILNMPHPKVMLETLRRSPRQMLMSWYIGFFQIPGLADWLLCVNNFSAIEHMLKASGKEGTFSCADMVEYKKAWAQPGALTGMINWYRAAFRTHRGTGLDIHVHIPTMMLWGKRDTALSEEMAHRSIELCDKGRLVIFNNATHWVQHDEALQVNRLLTTFFD